jgi:large subunit ribosomal protein L4e
MVLIIEVTGSRVIPVLGANGEKVGEAVLPPVFHTPVRKDLIRRAFLAEFTARLQPKGRNPMAGKRTTAESLGADHGLARVPRVKGTTRARLVNMAVGGRLAHPPRVEKKIVEEINKKEKLLATASAIAATASLDLVRKRGHLFRTETLPVVIDSSLLNTISKTKDARKLLEALGLIEDVERAERSIGIRAGKGKMRGRRYVEAKSVLFVLDNHRSPLALALRGLPGVDVVTPRTVSVLDLAPGGVPGRLTVYTNTSLATIQERFDGKLFFIETGGE